MSTIEERVKKITIEQLGVSEAEVWKKNLILKFLTKKLKKSLLFKRQSITLTLISNC